MTKLWFLLTLMTVQTTGLVPPTVSVRGQNSGQVGIDVIADQRVIVLTPALDERFLVCTGVTPQGGFVGCHSVKELRALK